jgi:hypothetical protein
MKLKEFLNDSVTDARIGMMAECHGFHSKEIYEVFLALPRKSALSERIWSRATRVFPLRRARLDYKLVSCMMFVKENANFLRNHYRALDSRKWNRI